MPSNDYSGFMQWGQPGTAPQVASPVPQAGNYSNFLQPSGGVNSLGPQLDLSTPALGGGGPDTTQGNWWSNFAGKQGADGQYQQGWGIPALQTFTGLAGAYLGMQQYGLAKDSLKENKRQFQLNYDAQRKLTNSSLEGRQRAKIAAGENVSSVADYMKKYGV